MLDRRAFLHRFLGASALVAATPIVALAASPEASTTTREIPEVIVGLENQVKALQGEFSYTLHNELRHLYHTFDTDQSRKHADLILKHHMMDDYILNTLSDWYFHSNNPQDGIAKLYDNAYRYNHYVHVFAACLIRAGMEYQRHAMVSDANSLFRLVLENGRAHLDVVPTLRPYHELASRLITA